LLQPGSSPTSIGLGFYYRYYPATHSYVGVKDGMVYYLAPASSQQLVAVATLANFLAMARAAGY
ncbi:MAG: hypothetical protein H7255_13805, partial [Ramlibacter sp.]|nr:hypothetical protein [Ramlibacter sp.]